MGLGAWRWPHAGSVFLGDMRVPPTPPSLICIFPAALATELKIWSWRAHPGDLKPGSSCRWGGFAFWILQKRLIWFLQSIVARGRGLIFQQKHTTRNEGALPWVPAPLPFSFGAEGFCWARGAMDHALQELGASTCSPWRCQFLWL